MNDKFGRIWYESAVTLKNCYCSTGGTT